MRSASRAHANAQVALVEAASAAARVATTETQALAQISRDKGLEFHKALVVFRRVLASVVGQRSQDYQILRYRRVRQSEDAADAIVDDAAGSAEAVTTGGVSVAAAGRTGPELKPGEVAAE